MDHGYLGIEHYNDAIYFKVYKSVRKEEDHKKLDAFG